jgi:putative spermidine/putrescine transport system substrate-binding protein
MTNLSHLMSLPSLLGRWRGSPRRRGHEQHLAAHDPSVGVERRHLPRRLGRGIASMLLLAAFGATDRAQAQTITLVNQGGAPGEAQKVAIFEPFTKETGIQIKVDTYNQELAKIRAQIETKNAIWDVVSLNPLNERAGCEEGLLEKIDWKSLIDPRQFEAIGGFGECGAPYLVSPGAMVYDGAKFSEDKVPKSWMDFWDVKKFPGKRGMVFQPDQTLEPALMADGVAPADVIKVLTGPGGVDRAFRKLAEIKPYVKWWKAGDESMQLILTGEVDMVYAWQGRVNIANRSNKRDLRIVWPAGYVNALIYLGIMKGSPRKAEAIKLIQYQLAAQPQARFAELMGYPPANSAAYSMLSAEKRASLPEKYAAQGMMQGGSQYLNFWLDNGDSIRQRFATFTAQ